MCPVNLHEDDKKFTSYEMLLTQAEMSFHTMKKDVENPYNGNSILIDSCRTTCIFGKHGRHLLTIFYKAEEPVKIKCNGGFREVHIIANFGSFHVWYVLSLQAVKAKDRVAYDSENGGAFCIHTNHGVIEVKEHPNGLHNAAMDEIKWVVKNKKNRCFTIIHYEYDDDVVTMLDTICRKY